MSAFIEWFCVFFNFSIVWISLQKSRTGFFFLKDFYLFSHERHTERDRERGRDRRSRLPAGARCGTRSGTPGSHSSWRQMLNCWAIQTSLELHLSWIFKDFTHKALEGLDFFWRFSTVGSIYLLVIGQYRNTIVFLL